MLLGGIAIPKVLERVARWWSPRQFAQTGRVLFLESPSFLLCISSCRLVFMWLIWRWPYLEPVGNIGIDATDLSNAVIENIYGLAGLKSGLQVQSLAYAQTLLASCCSSTCCGPAQRGETYRHSWILLPIHCD
jgi:hypothetical protein